MDNRGSIVIEDETKLSRITLAELPFFECSIQVTASLYELTILFKQIPSLPGAIILNGKSCVGMISREKCFETLGRPFGVELYLKKPLSEFLQKNGGNALILQEKIPIRDAVNRALMRQTEELYDPIIISVFRNRQFRLVDMRTLLKAQSDMLSSLVVEVEKLSNMDPLTGLLNRRGFFKQARACMDHARKNDFEIALIMLDFDLFKTVNDIYGHQIGDRVIQNVAQEFTRTVRETDITGRYGGEEFIAMLIDTTESEALSVAERFRQRIEGMIIQTEFYNISMTISIGVCHTDAGSTGLESMLSRADKAL